MSIYVKLTSYERQNLVDFTKVVRLESARDQNASSTEFVFYLEGTSFHYTLEEAVASDEFFAAFVRVLRIYRASSKIVDEEMFLAEVYKNTSRKTAEAQLNEKVTYHGVLFSDSDDFPENLPND